MSLLPSTVSLLTPGWLLFIPVAAAGLVYAYRRRGRGPNVQVGTTFLLKQLARQSSFRRSFAPPARFFFELLLLTFLLFIAAGVVFKGGERQIAIVVDNSFSQFARVLNRTPTVSRIDIAKAEIRELLLSLSPFTTVTLYTSSPELRAVTDVGVSPTTALTALPSIAGAYAGDRLDTDLSQLLGNQALQGVYVWSDRGLPNLGTTPPPPALQLHTLTFGEHPNNIAITGLRLVRSGAAPEETSIEARLTAFSSMNTPVTAVLRRHIGSPEPITADQKAITLRSGETQSVRFSGVKRADAYSVALLTGTSNAPSLQNAIIEDDVAFISSAPSRRTVQVTSPRKISELGLQQIRSFDFQESGAGQDRTALQLFHQTMPATLPNSDAFIIAPPAGRGTLDVSSVMQNVTPTRWIEAHPLVTYAKLDLLAIPEARPIVSPAWALEVVSSASGGLLVAGEYRGHRYVVSAFELLPFEGKKEPLLSVLTLNCLQWLSQSTLDSGYSTPFSALTDSEITAIVTPRGTRQTVAPTSTETPRLTDVGLYRITRRRNEETLLPVSFFDERESDLRSQAPLMLSTTLVEPRSEALRSSSVFAWIALMILLGDMAFQLLRRREARE